jgi:hypothetical protein
MAEKSSRGQREALIETVKRFIESGQPLPEEVANITDQLVMLLKDLNSRVNEGIGEIENLGAELSSRGQRDLAKLIQAALLRQRESLEALVFSVTVLMLQKQQLNTFRQQLEEARQNQFKEQ